MSIERRLRIVRVRVVIIVVVFCVQTADRHFTHYEDEHRANNIWASVSRNTLHSRTLII